MSTIGGETPEPESLIGQSRTPGPDPGTPTPGSGVAVPILNAQLRGASSWLRTVQITSLVRAAWFRMRLSRGALWLSPAPPGMVHGRLARKREQPVLTSSARRE